MPVTPAVRRPHDEHMDLGGASETTMPADPSTHDDPPIAIESISAVTLYCRDIRASIGFYESLGFEMIHGGAGEPLTSFRIGQGFLNLIQIDDLEDSGNWGRLIIHVSNVDDMYALCIAMGWRPTTEPADAPWGERYFHLCDPTGHEISFARPLD
jgi:catechol 2,3-dioxygenase-like lactoylglutathione lyase family enzyme